MIKKSEQAYRNIREVSEILELEPHVLRFWESKFENIKPLTRGGGRRYYSPDDISLLQTVKELLHVRGITIKAASEYVEKYGSNAIYVAPQKEDVVEEKQETENMTTKQSTSSNDNEIKIISNQLNTLETNANKDIARIDIILKKINQAA